MNVETVDLTYFIYAKKDTLRCAASCISLMLQKLVTVQVIQWEMKPVSSEEMYRGPDCRYHVKP